MKRKILSVILTAAAVCFATVSTVSTVSAESVPQTGDSAAKTVTIYTTNDIHGVVEESGTAIGLAQTAGIAASTDDSLLVDAGDATQGASFATITQGADVIKMMNAAGYDVMTAGNHEFDYGADVLLSNVSAANFPILGANVLRDGSPLLEPNAVITAGGHKIGFIGITTVATATSTNPSKLAGITFEDEVKTTKEQIAKLSDTADTIIIVCHLGNNQTAVKCTSEDLIKALTPEEQSKIAAVIDGHSHTLEDNLLREPQFLLSRRERDLRIWEL